MKEVINTTKAPAAIGPYSQEISFIPLGKSPLTQLQAHL